MPRGGPRSNAGRKAGVHNKRSAALAAAVEASGITPLDYMLSLLRNPDSGDVMRFEAAKAAAPYVHAKLSSVDANVHANVDGSVTFTWLPPS